MKQRQYTATDDSSPESKKTEYQVPHTTIVTTVIVQMPMPKAIIRAPPLTTLTIVTAVMQHKVVNITKTIIIILLAAPNKIVVWKVKEMKRSL